MIAFLNIFCLSMYNIPFSKMSSFQCRQTLIDHRIAKNNNRFVLFLMSVLIIHFCFAVYFGWISAGLNHISTWMLANPKHLLLYVYTQTNLNSKKRLRLCLEHHLSPHSSLWLPLFKSTQCMSKAISNPRCARPALAVVGERAVRRLGSRIVTLATSYLTVN